MSDFDTRVRSGLLRLEAAVPTPRLPMMDARPACRSHRRRQVVILLAAALLLLAGTALATMANQPPRTSAQRSADAASEERLRDDLGKYLETGCLSQSQATALIRSRLDALGLSDWTIRVDDRIREAQCVSGAPIGDNREVLLTASMGDTVAKALDDAGADLLRNCLGRNEAVAYLRAVLLAAGARDPKVETGGPRGIPLVNGDAYVKHIADGCYVYGGAQFDDVGHYTWYVSGN